MIKAIIDWITDLDPLEEEPVREPRVFINRAALMRERRQRLVESAPPAPQGLIWFPSVAPGASEPEIWAARQLAWAEAWADAIITRYP